MKQQSFLLVSLVLSFFFFFSVKSATTVFAFRLMNNNNDPYHHYNNNSGGKSVYFRPDGCRLFAVADLHGDLSQTKKVLAEVCKLVHPNTHHWIGGCATLVQLGDRVDRHHESIEVIDYLNKLAKEARKAGGLVKQLIGNHEGLQLTGQFQYVNHQEMEKKGGEDAWRNLFSQRGFYGQQLRRSSMVFFDDRSKTVFVHGGLVPKFARLGVDGINTLAKRQMMTNDFNNEKDPLKRGVAYSVFGEDGPVWDRSIITHAMQTPTPDCKLLDISLKLLHGHRMVVGHTPQGNKKVNLYCNDKLVAADVGISGSMASGLGAVEIVDGSATSDGETASVKVLF